MTLKLDGWDRGFHDCADHFVSEPGPDPPQPAEPAGPAPSKWAMPLGRNTSLTRSIAPPPQTRSTAMGTRPSPVNKQKKALLPFRTARDSPHKIANSELHLTAEHQGDANDPRKYGRERQHRIGADVCKKHETPFLV